jgi:hypothetical protein
MIVHLFLAFLLAIVLWRGGWDALVSTPDTDPFKQWLGAMAVLAIIVSVLMFF